MERTTSYNKMSYMSGANDCTIPVAHHDIVSILEAIRAGPVTDALLAFLELLKQTEVARYCPELFSQLFLCRLGTRTLSHSGRKQESGGSGS